MLCMLPATAQAQALTSETLIDWCQDARLVFNGISGTPLLRQDQHRSNATACAAYLRGWLEREVNARADVPNAQCMRPINENAEIVTNFLTMVSQPGYPKKELNHMMADFTAYYCPPLPAKTQIQAALPPVVPYAMAQVQMPPMRDEIPEIPPPPQSQIAMAPPVPKVEPVVMPEMPPPPPQSQIAMAPPAAVQVPVMPPPVAEPPKTQLAMAIPVMPPAPPEPVKLEEKIELKKPAPPEPVIDPTQTRIISSDQSRMLEAGEQSAIQIIK